MEPRLELLPEKKLVGRHLTMSLAEDKTTELWRSFMPAQKLLPHKVGPDLFSLQVYGPAFNFESLDVHATFIKWAAVEVSDFRQIPDGLEPFILPGGLYAVFLHQGAAVTAPATFGYIFGTWLPHSDYLLDTRPHFELLGEKYKNNDPASEEEIWLPVKFKEESKM